MRLLVDNCLSGRFAARLAAEGHDVEWAGDWGHDPGDAAILERAFVARRVLITRDQDFATLALAHGHRHAGMVRIVDTTTAESFRVGVNALKERQSELEAGSIVVAFLHSTRVH